MTVRPHSRSLFPLLRTDHVSDAEVARMLRALPPHFGTIQTLYLRASTAPTVGTLPSGAFGAWTFTTASKFGASGGYLSVTAGGAQIATNAGSNSVPNSTTDTFGILQCTSDALAAQTIASGNWTFAFDAQFGTAAATKTWQGQAGLYVAKSDGTSRGTIFTLGAIGSGGRSATANRTCYSTTVSGSSVVCSAQDYLVLEIGVSITNASGSSAACNPLVNTDGTTAISSDNVANSSAQSLITAPAALTLYTAGSGPWPWFTGDNGSGGMHDLVGGMRG